MTTCDEGTDVIQLDARAPQCGRVGEEEVLNFSYFKRFLHYPLKL